MNVPKSSLETLSIVAATVECIYLEFTSGLIVAVRFLGGI